MSWSTSGRSLKRRRNVHLLITIDTGRKRDVITAAFRSRYRPLYEDRDDIKSFDDAEGQESCRKFYSTYSKRNLTGGLMGLWCPHLVCLGFHFIPRAEGRNDVFSALWVYFEKAPRTVVYDFACQLAPYSMAREPAFFKDTVSQSTKCTPLAIQHVHLHPFSAIICKCVPTLGMCIPAQRSVVIAV